jgi:hypothetical protein
VSDARRILFAGLIDDAGLFPPANLSMAAALESHFAARASDEQWILGRFLCPASRLDELLTELPPDDTLRVGIVLDMPELPNVADERTAVETVEVRVADAGAVDAFPDVPGTLYFEGPVEIAPAAAQRGGGLKIRCGGVTAEAFPRPEHVARFLAGCRAAGVPFKATAGLHHPIRHLDGETGFTHHGFLNLLAAAALVLDPATGEADLCEVLADEDKRHFTVGPQGLGWRDRRVDARACARVRSFFVGFGCCSFSEPVDDLRSLGVLPQPAAAR